MGTNIDIYHYLLSAGRMVSYYVDDPSRRKQRLVTGQGDGAIRWMDAHVPCVLFATHVLCNIPFSCWKLYSGSRLGTTATEDAACDGFPLKISQSGQILSKQIRREKHWQQQIRQCLRRMFLNMCICKYFFSM